MTIQFIILISKNRVLFTLFWLLFFNLTVVQAAELKIDPPAPVVEVDGHISLSVSGAIGTVAWKAIKGHIDGTGTQVIYWAPKQVGTDIVSVLDNAGNVGLVKIMVLSTQDMAKFKNSVWEIFTNRNEIHAIVLSEDGDKLWVATNGGLEQRDTKTGQIKSLLTNKEGLPHNYTDALATDGNNGLWIGTYNGLVHLTNNDNLKVFNTTNSSLPNNGINSLINDGNGGIWVGTVGGLAHISNNKKWTVFTTSTSSVPHNNISALMKDIMGGLWIGTLGGGLVYLHPDGNTWSTFEADSTAEMFVYFITSVSNNKGDLVGLVLGTRGGIVNIALTMKDGKFTASRATINTNNSPLESNFIYTVISDDEGDLWLGTGAGLAHIHGNGKMTIFNHKNSKLPSDKVFTLRNDGKGGIWIGTWGGGLAHLNRYHEWTLFNTDSNARLPSNWILAFASDKNGLWFGTKAGLVHLDSNKKWTIFNIDNSDLPDNSVFSVLSDSKDGLWIGTNGGLAHLSADKKTWKTFNTKNSDLPDNFITYLMSDNQGGVWIGTKGLAHLDSSGKWKIFDSTNSDLPVNSVNAFVEDGNNGLWVATMGGGLVHLNNNGKGTVFNTTNSMLPNNYVTALTKDGKGGLWIGTMGGLAHLFSSNWKVFNKDNSGLPSNEIYIIMNDGSDGIWVAGVEGFGLARLNSNGGWTVFNQDNSTLPDNRVYALIKDGSHGLWIGGYGLSHLSFGTLETIITKTGNENLRFQKRAAIIIAGGGAQSTNSLWDTTEAISNHIYKLFYKRGFDKSEIYYLSPKSWADFNGDGFNDSVTRTPKENRDLMVEDVRLALAWAKKRGKLDQPLYLFFIDHGGPDKLQLGKNTHIKASEFKAILDDYQNTTSNKLVLVIEACHSGAFIKHLAVPNRAIISSAKADEKAYFVGKQGFTRFLANNILKGMNLFEAFEIANHEQQKMRGKDVQAKVGGSIGSTLQTPQFDDNADGSFTKDDGQWLKQIYVNGNFKTGDITLAVDSITTSTSLVAGKTIILKAKASTVVGQVKQVWAVIRPPRMDFVLDTNGTPILAFPRLFLSPTKTENVWQASWGDAIYNGDYEITFYAEDNEGNIASSDKSVNISVTGGVDAPQKATVQLVLNTNSMKPGQEFKAELIENLAWGYDLYAALVLPDGQFMTLKNTNKLAELNQTTKWRGQRIQNSPVNLLSLNLPNSLAKGQYCLYGILSPEKESAIEAMSLWVMEKQCFEVVVEPPS